MATHRTHTCTQTSGYTLYTETHSAHIHIITCTYTLDTHTYVYVYVHMCMHMHASYAYYSARMPVAQLLQTTATVARFLKNYKTTAANFWKLQNYSLGDWMRIWRDALEIFLGIWRNTNTYCFKHDANALRAFFAYCFKHVKMRTCMQMRQNVPKCVTLRSWATKLQNI